MLPSEPRVGYIFRYAYLWHRQYQEGREEADKDRPCLVLAIVAADDAGQRIVRVLPITHSPPDDLRAAIEIPLTVKERLRLDTDRSWIVLNESNRFVWPGPDLRPVDTDTGYYGPLPPSLFSQVKNRFIELIGKHRPVARTE
ncbi:type II toxin-antitoxin system PemK/MazF family toxin [Labrys sp. LIt4]|uniref:type II toxin-antitoxin system PemK/MazF family toxin n=1 Tax=Labrys sp. LIt4 TaxID=2821355 RepID=UPI001ADEE18B|nr:type II toxin-antitoxin system PemK/MazF family toxin [Labrys sp. LIt4]MBP0579875.1 type II toxin-antitoxin system PemK/MazF family toxin [Labrys sp. LIt4]